MADNNRLMSSQEIEDEKRKRQLAIVKASNQMLNEAMEKALDNTSDPVRRSELQERFNVAIEQNDAFAQSYLHASKDEVEKSTFRDVDPSEVTKYNERLKKRGLTDEEVHRKDMATVTVGKNGEKAAPIRRRRRGAKKDLGDDYQKLDIEEEFMKQTLVNDDIQIQKNIEKNKEFEEEMRKQGKDIISKIVKPFEDENANKKISMEENIQTERIEINNKPQENSKEKKEKIHEVKNAEVKEVKKKTKKTEEVLTYDFDFSSVPSYVQYDVLPLPSKGQCYPKNSPLRCGRIPVAYLTAADENIIASPNVYRDGKLLDIILDRKILDKRINANDLCSGDRDAIILWLRGTSYGEDFPISATNPETGKQYNVTISLSQFDYKKFELEGDENGLFDFETNNGDLIKFKFFTNKDEEKLRKIITSQITDSNKFEIFTNLKQIIESLNRMSFTEEETNMLNEDIDEINDIVGDDLEENTENTYPNTITEQMIMHTVSVNGNEDREFIKNYIENMRTRNALDYRNYFIDNKPGVDFNFTVNIPESDGGGSFTTFLRIDDTIFINF